MKSWKLYIVALGGAVLVLSGCAEFNSALGSVNSALGKVTDTAVSVTGIGDDTKVYDVGDRSSASYEIKNLRIGVYGINPSSSGVGFSSHAGVHFKGSVRNKTKQDITVNLELPVYDQSGGYIKSVFTQKSVPAGETATINSEMPGEIDWNSGDRPNAQKLKISIQKF